MRNPQVRIILVGLSWLLGLAALPFLPNPSPIHWDAMGRANGFASPLVAALLVPTLLFIVTVLAPLLPRLDPRGAAYATFRPTYELFMNATAAFLLLVQVLVLGASLGLLVDIPRLVGTAVGLLFVLIGNELGRVQPNYFVGIRTPWTLASPEVWRRTHRVGGRAMAAAGLLGIIVALALPAPWSLYSVVALVLSASLGSVAYSYIVFRQSGSGQAR